MPDTPFHDDHDDRTGDPPGGSDASDSSDSPAGSVRSERHDRPEPAGALELAIACPDLAATARAAAGLAACLEPGDVIGLAGDLGAGKTAFVQAVARALRVPPKVRITSPTFALINEYRGGALAIYHADLYRLDDARELDELGLDEICRVGDGVVLVEWCDRFDALEGALGGEFVRVAIAVGEAGERALTATAAGPRGEALLAGWRRGERPGVS